MFESVDRAFVFPAQGVEAFVEAAVATGILRFTVMSSLAAAQEFPRDQGSASQLHHGAVQAAVTEHTDAWTILRPGTFANNLLAWAWQVRSGAPIRAPFMASAQAPIHEYDVAEVAAESLLTDDHLGEVIAMTGPEAVTRAEQVTTIARGARPADPGHRDHARGVPRRDPAVHPGAGDEDAARLLERHAHDPRPPTPRHPNHRPPRAHARAMGG